MFGHNGQWKKPRKPIKILDPRLNPLHLTKEELDAEEARQKMLEKATEKDHMGIDDEGDSETESEAQSEPESGEDAADEVSAANKTDRVRVKGKKSSKDRSLSKSKVSEGGVTSKIEDANQVVDSAMEQKWNVEDLEQKKRVRLLPHPLKT